MNWLNVLYTVGMLISGCVNTISKKAQNETVGAGYDEEPHKFTHPWFQTILMFFGEALCLIIYAIQRNSAKRRTVPREGDELLISQRVWQPLLLIPMTCDLLGTTFGGIGLVYVTASIWQMLRGSIIVFTALLSLLFLKKKLLPYRWFSICFTITGLVCVGLTGIFNAQDIDVSSGSVADEESTSSVYTTVLGIVMILVGQLVCASQMVFEEKLLKGHDFAPMHMVGFEGSFGALAMAFIVLPILFFVPGEQKSPWSYDVYENSWDAILQMAHSWQLTFFGSLYLISIAFYNFFGLSVTKHLSCVHRTLIDACRTILVWTFQLFLNYCTPSSLGEPWTRWSWLQVLGFCFLLFGTLCYNAIIKFPFFRYEEPATKAEAQPLLKDESDPAVNKDETK